MFTTFFGLRLCQSIFAPTEQLSCVLQGKDTTVQEAREAAITTEMYLRRQRTEASFDRFYDEVVTDSATLTDEPVLPRRHKLPKRINDGSSSHQFATPKDMFRQIYFEAFDVVSQEISNRFRQNDLEVVAEMEQLLLESANGQQYPISDKIKSLYSSDLNIDRLILHLNMLPDLIKRYSAVLGSEIKKVTSVCTICDAMNNIPSTKDLFSEVNNLLQLFLTVPVTTATSERTFSSLRRVKSYLRTTMTQERLNHLLLLYCHKSRTDSLDMTKMANSFISVNDRRAMFFGSHIIV